MFNDDDMIRKIFRSEDFGYEINATPETAEREFYVDALRGEIRKRTDKEMADRLDALTFKATSTAAETAFRYGIRFALLFIVQAMTPQMSAYDDEAKWKEFVKETMEG
jgi:hypothetical protein